jgi:hypothetical protein
MLGFPEQLVTAPLLLLLLLLVYLFRSSRAQHWPLVGSQPLDTAQVSLRLHPLA